MFKLCFFIFSVIGSVVFAQGKEQPWEKDIEMGSVYACAGKADPSEGFGNDGVMPMFLKFNVALEWYLPFYNGTKSTYLLYTDTVDENAHLFYTLDESLQMRVKAFSVDTEPTPILNVWLTPTNPARAVEVGAPLVQHCANVPIEIFSDTLPK